MVITLTKEGHKLKKHPKVGSAINSSGSDFLDLFTGRVDCEFFLKFENLWDLKQL
jgi:hypothetical protein